MSDDTDLFRFPCGHEIPMAEYVKSRVQPYCTLCHPKKK